MPSKDAGEPLIWERLERPPRGPQPSLSHEAIVRAAIEIADGEGLEGVTMRRLAAHLDAGTMSLYRYVSRKDDLIELMVDQVTGELLPAAPSGDWRADLAASARTARRVALRHPWSAPLLSTGRPSMSPNQLRLIEQFMTCLDGLGLDVDGMLDLVTTVQSFVMGVVQGELAEEEARRRSGETVEEFRTRMAPYLERVLATGEHPWLERIIIEAEDFPDPDVVFERRLGYVLDGLDRRVSGR